MSGSRIALIGGGVRSGKSAFALELARGRGPRRVFIATAQPLDAEMQARIVEHARFRGDDFKTIEEPFAVPAKLAELHDVDVVVVDCLTLWLSNLLPRDEGEARILEQVDALARVIERCSFHVVLVTNEVGMGVVPETPLGRAFRDLAGRAHQRLASIAHEIYLAVLGVVLRVRPEPVSIQSPKRG
jgi:adenosylcobinamide kinase/adenosylcobinamide-phosphate guanylyltransferase